MAFEQINVNNIDDLYERTKTGNEVLSYDGYKFIVGWMIDNLQPDTDFHYARFWEFPSSNFDFKVAPMEILRCFNKQLRDTKRLFIDDGKDPDSITFRDWATVIFKDQSGRWTPRRIKTWYSMVYHVQEKERDEEQEDRDLLQEQPGADEPPPAKKAKN